MSKTLKIYGAVLLVFLILIGLLEAAIKPSVNWRKNFDPSEKSPFGLFVFAQEAAHLFRNKLLKEKTAPYHFYSQKKEDSPHNIILVNRSLDKPSIDQILKNVENGTVVLWAEYSFPMQLQDTLDFRTGQVSFDDRSILKFTDKKLKKDSLLMDKLPEQIGFISFRPEHEILGVFQDQQLTEHVNFMKIPYGKGLFYLHTEPLFFTNFYLLKKPGGLKYLNNSLSFLPDRKTIWFMEAAENESQAQGQLSFILSKPALRYAWWLFLAGLLLFVIFNVKRKQRKIPVIEPKKNKSVEFVQSIGNLYLQEGDFHEMMAKKSTYFLHRVRQELMLDTEVLDETFAEKLQHKTGTDQEIITEAIELIKRGLDPYASVQKEDLFRLNKLLDELIPSYHSDH